MGFPCIEKFHRFSLNLVSQILQLEKASSTPQSLNHNVVCVFSAPKENVNVANILYDDCGLIGG